MTDAMPELVLDAAAFNDIPGFYACINHLFMQGEDWMLGPSLDALDDMLYGGYGILRRHPQLRLIWRGMEKSQRDLGRQTTLLWLEEKLLCPGQFDRRGIEAQIAALKAGDGQTYFQILQEIFAGHPNVILEPG